MDLANEIEGLEKLTQILATENENFLLKKEIIWVFINILSLSNEVVNYIE